MGLYSGCVSLFCLCLISAVYLCILYFFSYLSSSNFYHTSFSSPIFQFFHYIVLLHLFLLLFFWALMVFECCSIAVYSVWNSPKPLWMPFSINNNNNNNCDILCFLRRSITWPLLLILLHFEVDGIHRISLDTEAESPTLVVAAVSDYMDAGAFLSTNCPSPLPDQVSHPSWLLDKCNKL